MRGLADRGPGIQRLTVFVLQVTLSLSDVALQCLLTRQGESQQTVPLQPGEMKTSARQVHSQIAHTSLR